MKRLFIMTMSIFALLFLYSCAVKNNPNHTKQIGFWQYMGEAKDGNKLLYLNSSYIRYDKKTKSYRAILKEMPGRKEQNAMKKQFEQANKKTEKRFGEKLKGRKNLLAFLIKKQTGYYIVTTVCKDNKFIIHYPALKDIVSTKKELSKNIYKFICH